MPAVSPKQKQLIAMDLKRAESGQKTYTAMIWDHVFNERTGMMERQLHEVDLTSLDLACAYLATQAKE